MKTKKWLIIFGILMLISISTKLIIEKTDVGKILRENDEANAIVEKPFDNFMDKYIEMSDFCKRNGGGDPCLISLTEKIFKKYPLQNRLNFCDEISALGLDPFCYPIAVSVESSASYEELRKICDKDFNDERAKDHRGFYVATKRTKYLCVTKLIQSTISRTNTATEQMINDSFTFCEKDRRTSERCFRNIMGDYMYSDRYMSHAEFIKRLCSKYPNSQACYEPLLNR